jgi:hypothetical protein
MLDVPPKAGVVAPSGVDGNGPKRFSVQRDPAPSSRHEKISCVDHLAATRNVALRLQMMAKALEQSLDQASLCQRLTEQP